MARTVREEAQRRRAQAREQRRSLAARPFEALDDAARGQGAQGREREPMAAIKDAAKTALAAALAGGLAGAAKALLDRRGGGPSAERDEGPEPEAQEEPEAEAAGGDEPEPEAREEPEAAGREVPDAEAQEEPEAEASPATRGQDDAEGDAEGDAEPRTEPRGGGPDAADESDQLPEENSPEWEAEAVTDRSEPEATEAAEDPEAADEPEAREPVGAQSSGEAGAGEEPPESGVDDDRQSSDDARGASIGDASEIVDEARDVLERLTGGEAERVSALARANGNWSVTLEVVEVRRVPESTDVLSSYEIVLDDDRKLVRLARTRRYRRAQVEEAP